jgi:starvation-inducible DNA-binding protein
MNELQASMQRVLADTFLMYIKTHTYHWNVVGPNFSQYHKFFGKLYEEVYDSLDKTAEYIRILDSYTPGSLERFKELSIIPDQLKIPRAELMMAELYENNEAYQSHVLTRHFKKYKEAVKNMVLSLELIDVDLIVSAKKSSF